MTSKLWTNSFVALPQYIHTLIPTLYIICLYDHNDKAVLSVVRAQVYWQSVKCFGSDPSGIRVISLSFLLEEKYYYTALLTVQFWNGLGLKHWRGLVAKKRTCMCVKSYIYPWAVCFQILFSCGKFYFRNAYDMN